MRHLRLFPILCVFCIGTLLLVHTGARAQYPSTVSYQGVLQHSGTPVTGYFDLTINYYSAGSNVVLATETFRHVLVENGIFNLNLGEQLGSMSSLYATTQRLEIGIKVDDALEFVPRTPISAVPYAYTAYSVLGVPGSRTPANNTIFPLPVDTNGRLGTGILPPVTINGLPMYNNNLGIVAGNNITVSTDPATGRITLESAIGEINAVAGGAGITSTTTNGNVALAVNADPANFKFVGQRMGLRQDVPVIGTDASFKTLTVETNGFFGGGLITYGLRTSNIVSLGDAWINGNINLEGSISSPEFPLNIRTPRVDFHGAQLHDIAAPVEAKDAATKRYVDLNILEASYDVGDVQGWHTNLHLNPNHPGMGDRILDGISHAEGTIDDRHISDQLTLTQSNISESRILSSQINSTGIGLETPDAGAFTTLTTGGLTTLATQGANVGIGTSEPATLLDMRGATELPLVAQLENSTGDATLRAISSVDRASALELADQNGAMGTIRTTGLSGMEFHLVSPAIGPSFYNPDQLMFRLGWDNSISFTAATLDFNHNRLQNLGEPLSPADAVTKGYVDALAHTAGDITGRLDSTLINALSDGIGNRLMMGVNLGTDKIDGQRVRPYFDQEPLFARRANMNQVLIYDNTASPTTTALEIKRGTLRATASAAQQGEPGATMSERYADFASVTGSMTTIRNLLVTSTSTIIITLEVPGGDPSQSTGRDLFISDKRNGEFTVASRPDFPQGALLHYMIINSGAEQ